MDETPKDISKFCGDPIWPANGEGRYTVQFQLSCGYVIVNPEGIESTLGYANKHQADIVAEAMTEGHAFGKAEARASLTERDGEIERLRKALTVIAFPRRGTPEETLTVDQIGEVAARALTQPTHP